MTEQELLVRAKGLKILMEVSDPKRLRNSEYIRHKVVPKNATAATVGDWFVALVIKDRPGNFPKVEHSCNCPDHGKQGACKHVLAFAYNILLGIKLQWEESKKNEK